VIDREDEESTTGSERGCRTVIAGFHQDPEGHWVAELACGHTQHMRHRPPWENRPWVESADQRAAKIGVPIACAACEMPAIPDGVQEYRRSATFTEDNVPAGLLREHGTKPGVWALIVVESGQLDYTFESPLRTFLLGPERPGIIPPEVPHHVSVIGPVRFHVEFLAAPTTVKRQ
jgi:tellurite methyltransferase